MSRRFFRPGEELGAFVQFGFAFSDYRARGDREVRRVPTARATLYYAADVTQASSGRSVTGLFCEGPHSTGFEVKHDCGEMIAMKVRSGGLRALLGVPAIEVRDSTVPLEEFWGVDAAMLAEQMASASGSEERVSILRRHLVMRSRQCAGRDRVASALSSLIERRRGDISVRALVARSGYSQRAVLQKFDECVGLTPKQHARLTRLRAVIARLGEGPTARWADLALEYGFCDQPHMTHEFRSLVGLPPTRFIADRSAFSPVGGPAFGQHAVPSTEQRLYRSLGIVSDWVRRDGQAVAGSCREPSAEIYNTDPAEHATEGGARTPPRGRGD